MGHLDRDDDDDDDDDDNDAWEVTMSLANMASIGDPPKDVPGSVVDDPLPRILVTPAAMTSMESSHDLELNAALPALPGAQAQGECILHPPSPGPTASKMISMVEDDANPTCTSEVTLSNLARPEDSANTSSLEDNTSEDTMLAPIQETLRFGSPTIMAASALIISGACIFAQLFPGGHTDGDGHGVAYSSIFQGKEEQAATLSTPQPLSMTPTATPHNLPHWLSHWLSSCAQAFRLRLAHS